MTLHVRVALNSQNLLVVGNKPFPANQNTKYVCFNCAFQNTARAKKCLPFWWQAQPGAKRRRQTLPTSAA